jgi:hypothetical protein
LIFIKYIGRFVTNTFLLNSNNYSNQKPWLDILPTINRPIGEKWISASTLIAKYKLAESLLDGINRITGSSTIAAKYPSLDKNLHSQTPSDQTH